MLERTLVKTDKNGTKYYHVRCDCGKCGGRGIINIYIPINGGECFGCGGSGIYEYDEKVYTPEYEEKLRIQAEKRAAKKLAEAKAHAAEKNAEFFKKNGFTEDGKTYFVLGNTYEIKEELKAQGAKWDNLSRHWHMPTKPEGREVLEIPVEDMFMADEAGVYTCWVRCEWADELYYPNRIEAAENAIKAQESTSQHVGEVGDRIEREMTYVHTASWENSYGGWLNHESVTNLHTFKDKDGNVFIWKTGLYIEADYGDKLIVKGTIKEHSDYKGIKQTVLTRCKITDVQG